MKRMQIYGLLIAALLACAFPGKADELPDDISDAFVPIAGEALDLAIEHCRRGQSAQAKALFTAILTQLDPPQAIRELIQALEQGGCSGSKSMNRQWELRAVAGYDDNVSQGVRGSSLALGPATYRVELVIDENYKPLPSAFAEMTVGHNWELSDRFTLQVKTGARHYAQASAYNLENVTGTLKMRLNAMGRPVELMGELTELWMGGHRYQTAWAMVAQAPIMPDIPQWNYTAVAQRVGYHTQPQQNATQFQLGVNRQFRPSPGNALLLGAMGIWDHALGQRAGGDRVGASLNFTSQIRIQPWLLTGRMSITRWSSRQDFLPGLVDAKRRNTLVQAGLQAEYPLSASQTLQFDLLARNSRDMIALYAYRAYSLGVSWNARF